jgi:nucleotide-binding universal stress UspA family protein
MRILLGIDAADDSLHALEQTVARVAETDDTLTVAIIDGADSGRAVDDVEADARQILEAAGIDAEIRHLGENAGSELVHIAESEGFDRIALSGGTTSPMGKIQIGNTTEFVLLNSHISVLLIR